MCVQSVVGGGGIGGATGCTGRSLWADASDGSREGRLGGLTWSEGPGVGRLVTGHAMATSGSQGPVDRRTARCLSPDPPLLTFLPPADVPRLQQDAARAVHLHGSVREPLRC